MKVAACQIGVTDMDEAIRFYVDVMGMTIVSRSAYPEMVELRLEDLTVVLGMVERPNNGLYGKNAQSYLILSTEDLTRTCERLRTLGVRFLFEEPQKFGPIQFTAFLDPFGNPHELIQK